VYARRFYIEIVKDDYIMDKLFECAKCYENLLDKKYHMIVGRKGKAVEIVLTFEAADFHHLIGLHKLSDIETV
jgi:hypothetical protein